MAYFSRSSSSKAVFHKVPIARVGIGKKDLIAIPAFVLAILGTNYAMSVFPNVKLFDLLVLSAGYVLGFRRGVAVAAGAWMIYGTFNPWGPADSLLLTVLMVSETVYAFAGSLLRQLVNPEKLKVISLSQVSLLVLFGFSSTLVYDLVTNAYTGLMWANLAGGSDYGHWIYIAMFNPGALLFSSVHIGSNIIIFATMAPLIIKGFTSLIRTLDKNAVSPDPL